MFLKIKLKRAEISDFAKIISSLYMQISETLTIRDYFHYYNLKSLWKRCFDSVYRGTIRKEIIFKVNINEFESLKYIIEMTQGMEIWRDRNYNYHRILLIDIVGQLDKEAVNINFHKTLEIL